MEVLTLIERQNHDKRTAVGNEISDKSGFQC